MKPGFESPAPTLDATLRTMAATRGDATFIVEESGHLTTYRDLDRAVDTTARRLDVHGVASGDAVGVLSTVTRDLIVLLYALHRLGAVAALVNPASTDREIAGVLRKSRAEFLIADTLDELAVGELPRVSGVRSITMEVLADTALPEEEAVEFSGPTPDIPATMIFTSGTTSEPKGVVYTHGHQMHGARNYARNLVLTESDLHMHHFPLFHMNGLNQLGSVLVSGARLLLVSRFRSSRFDSLVDQFGPTTTFLNGTHVKMLRSVDVPLRTVSSLERVGMSLQMSDEDYDWFENKYDAIFLEGYGLTESVALCLSNPPQGPRKRQCCGIPGESYEIRIVDGAGNDSVIGVPGELLVRSSDPYGIMHGYVDDAEATSSALTDGWLHTGDIVYRDADGYVFYVEREKELIKRAGENISANEVRDVIEAFDGVKEAAVVGRPDRLREEVPVAFLTVDGSDDLCVEDLKSFCSERLAAFKVPADFTVVESLPRTAVGKVERRTLQRWAESAVQATGESA